MRKSETNQPSVKSTTWLTPESPAANCWWTALSPRNVGYWQEEGQKELRRLRNLGNSMFIEPHPISRYDTRTFGMDYLRPNISRLDSGKFLSPEDSQEGGPISLPLLIDSDETPSSKQFSYPTWSLLGRNSCPDLKKTGGQGVGRTVLEHACKRVNTFERTRAHSQPPPSRNSKIAQRSSHTKIMTANRRCRSIGRTRGIDTTNHIRPRRTRGHDFRSLEHCGVSAIDASFSADEKQACKALFRQDTRALGLKRADTALRSCLMSPMEHPYFVWGLFMNNQTPISRIKLLHILAITQMKKHECHDDCNIQLEDIVLPIRKKEGLTLLQGSHSMARLGKAYNEDAAYMPENDGTHYLSDCFVAADGVGEWAQYGINSSVFSRTVVDRIGQELKDATLTRAESLRSDDGSVANTLLEAFLHGYEATVVPRCPVFGACTVIGGMVSEGKKLSTANIGDCSVIQLRRDPLRKMRMLVVKKTATSQHAFNTPKQFVHCPGPEHYDQLVAAGQSKTVEHIKAMRVRAAEHDHEICTDDPLEAKVEVFNLIEGDLLLCASDGVFDNLFDDEIAQMCSFAISPYEVGLFPLIADEPNGDQEDVPWVLTSEWLKGRLPHPNAMEPPHFIHHPVTGAKVYYTDPHNIARGLVEAAYARGLDPAANVPFGRSARRAGYTDLAVGGKADDTTCIAMWVVAKEESGFG